MLVLALYDYDEFIYFDLQDFWFVSGKSDPTAILIFHDLFAKWSIVHYTTLTGCDTTSKVVTKNKKLLNKEKNMHVACYITLEKMKLAKV